MFLHSFTPPVALHDGVALYRQRRNWKRRNDMKTYISIGLSALAACISLAALPVISETASEGRMASQWAAKVQSFETARALPLGDDFASEISTLHSPNLSLIAWQRDAAQTGMLDKLDYSLITKAENAAAAQACLAKAVYYEARSETHAGQKAVAEVVLNRVTSKHFPNDICGVVYQGAKRTTGCQFSFTCDGSLNTAPWGKSWERAQNVASYVTSSAYRPMTRNATHYHTTNINPHWANSLKSTRTIGSHAFYKFKSRREQALAMRVAP